ncbi:MAG: FKBP-type peptidyl-prolyl cis-trans isomerase [Thermodesulfobacteriota bacterium]
MNIKSGIKLLEESEGHGETAEKGDQVVYNIKLFLNMGEEVLLNQIQVKNMPEHLSHMVRTEGDYKFINHHTTLGKRETVAAVEYSLIGMKEGGYRKIKASPHLAYGENGIPGLIPKDAVLTIEIWLREIN